MEKILDNWWVILLLGGMVYLMVRGGGCGMGHRRQDEGESHSHEPAKDATRGTEKAEEEGKPKKKHGCC